jgi:hypothetical protein
MKKTVFLLLFFVVSPACVLADLLVVGGLTHERTASHGERFEGILYLKNKADRACKVKVYQTDYLYSADGTTAYGKPGDAPRSNANWISLSPSWLTVSPQGTASVYYTIKVPDSPDLKGTYWSIFMVEPIAEPDQGSPRAGKEKIVLGVHTVVRYGVQMVTHITDTGIRKLQFLEKSFVRENGRKVLQLDLENTGERMLAPNVWVELYDQRGRYIGRFESRQQRMFPACSVRHRIDLSEVPGGKYKALVIVDQGDEFVQGAQYDLTIQ